MTVFAIDMNGSAVSRIYYIRYLLAYLILIHGLATVHNHLGIMVLYTSRIIIIIINQRIMLHDKI